jgi:hypothetical protein
VVLYEFATEADENPDVIGWAPGAGSVLIECKLGRSDFLKDAAKTVRMNPRTGMGQRRYYLCPSGLIQVKDLPPKWGLLWATKGQIVVMREARGHPEDVGAASGAATEAPEVAGGPKGIDRITFLVSPNPGEELRPLDRVASGGEISRLMLALKTVIAASTGNANARVRTLVFDEVDAGIGGRRTRWASA